MLKQLLYQKMKKEKDTLSKSKAVINAKAKLMASESISRFSTLKYAFTEGKAFKDYDEIFKSLTARDHAEPEPLSEELQYYLSMINKLDYTQFEQILLKKYKKCIEEIRARLEQMAYLSKQNESKKDFIHQQKIYVINFFILVSPSR